MSIEVRDAPSLSLSLTGNSHFLCESSIESSNPFPYSKKKKEVVVPIYPCIPRDSDSQGLEKKNQLD